MGFLKVPPFFLQLAMKIPVVRQYSYIALFLHLVVLFAVCSLWGWAMGGRWFILSYVIYAVILLGIPEIMASDHKRGMRLLKREEFGKAIPCFLASYDYFERNKWIDRFRYVTVMSSSKMSYREMALCNVAFCYGQMGNCERMREYYDRALRDFPDNIVAKTALRVLDEMWEKGGVC